VPGALVFSYAEGLVMQTGVIHGTGLAFLRADVSVQAPVFVGDTIAVVVEVVAARAASTGARGVVTTRNTVVKRGGGTVLVYEPVRLIRGAG
jgi:acyl dehydratase